MQSRTVEQIIDFSFGASPGGGSSKIIADNIASLLLAQGTNNNASPTGLHVQLSPPSSSSSSSSPSSSSSLSLVKTNNDRKKNGRKKNYIDENDENDWFRTSFLPENAVEFFTGMNTSLRRNHANLSNTKEYTYPTIRTAEEFVRTKLNDLVKGYLHYEHEYHQRTMLRSTAAVRISRWKRKVRDVALAQGNYALASLPHERKGRDDAANNDSTQHNTNRIDASNNNSSTSDEKADNAADDVAAADVAHSNYALASRRVARERRRTPNYTDEEIKDLLQLIQDHSPSSKSDWTEVVESLTAMGHYGRTVESVKRKTHELHRKKRMIDDRGDVGNGDKEFELESNQFGSSGDADVVADDVADDADDDGESEGGGEMCNWVQCENSNCQKWRRLPLFV